MDEENNQLMDLLPCGYIITSENGVINYANNFMLKILQLSKKEVVNNKNIRDFLPLGAKVYFDTNINVLLKKNGNLNQISLEIKRNDGVCIPVLVNAKVVSQKHNNIKFFHYTFFDISHQKKIETELVLASHKQELLINKLTLSNNNYQLITTQLQKNKDFYIKQAEINERISEVGRVGSWEIDFVTGNLLWSSVTKQIYEIDTQTQPSLQEGISFFIEGESRTHISNVVLNSVRTGKSFDEELQILTAKGNKIWVRVIGFADRTKDKSVKLAPQHSHLIAENDEEQTIGLYGTFQDIDKQKKMMLLLQQSNTSISKDNAYLKSIIENNSFYIVKIDLTGAYTYFNPYFIEILGITPSDWLGKNSLGLILPEDHQLCIDVVESCFKEPNISHWAILRKPSKNGIVTNQWEFSLLKDENGNFTEFLCIGHEITPLINKQDELKKMLEITSIQNNRLQNFTHIISHNVRSHVANLFGIISITDLEHEEERETAWRLIQSTTTSLNETIHNLSQILSIQSEKQLPTTCLNIYTEIQRVLTPISILIESSYTTIVYDFKPTFIINTNIAYFESIILNLITNAIKYKKPDHNPLIKISTYIENGFKVINFMDNGIGINLKRHGHEIFGMYKTFHKNENAKGLGLFIIKTQIEAMGGKIEVESNVGEGTTFKVYFLEKSKI